MFWRGLKCYLTSLKPFLLTRTFMSFDKVKTVKGEETFMKIIIIMISYINISTLYVQNSDKF